MTRADACLELALTLTRGRRFAGWKDNAVRFMDYATTDNRLRALTLAVTYPGTGDDVIATADEYLGFIEVQQAPATVAENPAGQAERPRKTGRKGGSRRRA